MRLVIYSAALLSLAAASPAFAINACETQTLSCPTTMPVGGYCECTSRGRTEDGTVANRPPQGRRYNSTAGGCGTQPNGPGCR